MTDKPFIAHVQLKNYKSIASCDVTLHPLTFLVGPNGSGKSNFVDALRFVTDSLRDSLDHALRERGGIKEVRRRSGGHPTHFEIHLDFNLASGSTGRYEFRIGAQPEGGYEVQTERLNLVPAGGFPVSEYRVLNGEVVESTEQSIPAVASDRLYLVNASGLPAFRPAYDALSKMGFYNLNPDRIRDLQSPDAGDILARDGRNLASVLHRLARTHPDVKRRVEEYLAKVVPGVVAADAKSIGPKDTIEFRQAVAGARNPWHFLAANMSDGTLRALGVLVALLQTAGSQNGRSVPLVGIEEPELALHPAAAGVLLDSLQEASRSAQVLVTSHSPDLLDNKDIETESILAVASRAGVTQIGPLDAAGRTALRERLYTVGELLRLDQLTPEPQPARGDTHRQGSMLQCE
jgi:predicted ATPase